MSRPYAIFLDGGFVKHKLRSPNQPVTAARVQALIDEIKVHPYLHDMQLHRAYFYDARPLEVEVKRPDGEVIDFAKTDLAKFNKTLHSELEELPFLSLRFGELSMAGWQYQVRANRNRVVRFPITIEADEVKANVQQKGVDMRIGLDMASLTLKHHVKVIVLVTGDSDFIPAMKFARREGAQVILFSLGHGIKQGLVEHSDLVVREAAGFLPK